MPWASILLLVVIAALVWWFFPDPEPSSSEPPPSPPPVRCKLIRFENTSMEEKCRLYLKPEFADSCSGLETITFREAGSTADWDTLHAGTSINLEGRKSIHLEFRMDDEIVLDTTFTSGCTKLSPAELDNRKKLIVKAIEDFLKKPISTARYRAHELTRLVPDGYVILPDGSSSSGLRWQNDVFMLWPNKQLQVLVVLDDFGTVKRIELK
jgi:hypothetical protein